MYLYHTTSWNVSFLSHMACGRPQIWRSGKLAFWKVSWQGSRVSSLDHPQSITQTLTRTKKFCRKEKDLSWAKSFVLRKKIPWRQFWTRIILYYNEVKKGDLTTKKKKQQKSCRDVQLDHSIFQCLCYGSELKIFLILEAPLCRLKSYVNF